MTDHELKRAVSELSALRSEGEPIVTLYLDTAWKDEKQRERARVFVQDAVKRAVDRHSAHPQLEAMRRTLGRIAEGAAERHGQAARGESPGLAIFACEAIGLWRVMSAPRPFKDELCVDACPHLLQLARLREDVEPAIVAFVHGRGTQLYEVALGTMVDETTVEAAAPAQHGQGGRIRGGASPSPHGASGAHYEREAKNQRHAEEQVQKVHREAAELLRRMAEREPRAHVVLVGTSEAVGELERELPERVRARVLARLPRPPGTAGRNGSGKTELAARVVEKLLEHERRAEVRHVEHVIGEAMRGGLAVLGPEDVVLAVNERRVHRLILEEDFRRSWWRCRNCRALGTTHDEVCSYCQGPLARVDALGEELAGRVIAEDGEVEVVAHSNRLHSYDGVAALLRQARARGLSGRAGQTLDRS